ncbi:class I SAM-dependent methyltransferase [Vannielia litorea]|uniref:class I SAM-dependent methyltransferase n=1 Tax=Vannielia litorea TaxID=1217970 RepID=UPI001C95D8F7|nr:class I SAM-dependent methyltransferase [Vannielia litorea]MBY6152461.1 class I SAM-dependent methyltransferase [Vannielia litorea]
MIGKFRFKGGPEEVATDIRETYGYDGPMLDAYVGNEGPRVHKWHHYLPLYDRYFGRFRGKPVKFLEIGVWEGGSLQMWRRFFGPDAVIFGIDIDPKCAALDGKAAQVRIGSQDDPAFLAEVVREMGGIDVVLDDGSHMMRHIQASLVELFPKLSMGGTYMIEDLHTAYWPNWGGGVGAPRNFFNTLRPIIDDMHRWYHAQRLSRPRLRGEISGIHVHDSIVVFDKDPVHPPRQSMIGDPPRPAG